MLEQAVKIRSLRSHWFVVQLRIPHPAPLAKNPFPKSDRLLGCRGRSLLLDPWNPLLHNIMEITAIMELNKEDSRVSANGPGAHIGFDLRGR